jgi:hypothetical protein
MLINFILAVLVVLRLVIIVGGIKLLGVDLHFGHDAPDLLVAHQGQVVCAANRGERRVQHDGLVQPRSARATCDQTGGSSSIVQLDRVCLKSIPVGGSADCARKSRSEEHGVQLLLVYACPAHLHELVFVELIGIGTAASGDDIDSHPPHGPVVLASEAQHG